MWLLPAKRWATSHYVSIAPFDRLREGVLTPETLLGVFKVVTEVFEVNAGTGEGDCNHSVRAELWIKWNTYRAY